MRNPVVPHPQIDGVARGLQEAGDVISANGSVEAGEFLSQRGELILWLRHGGSIAGMGGGFPKQNFRKEGRGPRYMNISQASSMSWNCP
jgi:hypothetical protein